MFIDDEITGTEELIALDRANAGDYLADAANESKFDAKTLAHYKNFIDACLSNATSILATCRTIAAMPDLSPEVATQVIEPFLLRAHQATQSMFLGMLVVEHLATPVATSSTDANEPVVLGARATPQAVGSNRGHVTPPEFAPNGVQRICSFCGKTQAETPLVAGPIAYICAPCTRNVAAIHGIPLAD